jgi:sugar/nucleoside kinase (ribokinase family)
MRVDYVAFGIILDDIVFPDGRTEMGLLGGGGPQAAFGMRLWAERIGLVSGVGPDLPASARGWLQQAAIDEAGIRTTETPTARAWQVMEADGRRTQVFRVSGNVIGEQLGRTLERVPPEYREARGFHYGVHPDQPDLDFTRALARLGGLVSIEPFKNADRIPDGTALEALLGAAALFSPNLAEARSLVGPREPVDLVRRLADAGAQVIALRMGSDGALVFDARQGRAVHVPAVPVAMVDPVGAGNAFCGGFLVGWAETEDAATAGACGAVSASFLVEQVGIPAFNERLQTDARRRFENLRPQINKVQIL